MINKYHSKVYAFAKYYDIAFQYKDVKSECDFFEDALKKFSPHLDSKTFIEFAAGPGVNCIEMAKRGWNSTAVDISPEMRTYGLEKAKFHGVAVNYICADMVNFNSNERYDIASILCDSIPYILTNDDLIKHLNCVSACLNIGGLYILEMNHPRDIFNVGKPSTKNEWEAEREGCKIKIKWGFNDDVFDPVSQIDYIHTRLDYNDNGRVGTVEQVSPQRRFTATEFDALVTASGVFEIVGTFGALNTSVNFNNEYSAWRMVPILRKK